MPTSTAVLTADFVGRKFITIAELASILSVSDTTIRRMARRGEGPKLVKLSPRRVGFYTPAVEACLASELTASEARG